MLKKIVIITLLTLSNLFACGCLDPGTAQAGAKQIIRTYQQQDRELAASFEELLREEQNSFNLEAKNSENTKKILFNNVDILVYVKKIKNLYIKIENYLFSESKINEIKSE